jgi:four helix bundle protein
MAIQSYRELIAWQKAMDLVEAVYQATADFPREETYGLTAQIRRAAVSVPSNIAEGQGRRSRGEFKQFLGNAKGSLCELETQVLIAQRLQMLSKERAEALVQRIVEVARILGGLIASL